MKNNQYRPDIDGLRAIAVLSVLLHHLNASLLPGGFVGVDIFFVISGYLITSHIYKEISDGTFSLKHFYKRRINRIVPALVTVIVASLVVGIFVLSPEDLIRLAKSSVYAVLGLSNVYLWHEYGNYFEASTGEVPLLHTWSLGVEEQFYVIWPLLILILIKLKRELYIIGAFAILAILATAVSQIAVGIFASASYYLIPTRFFELMIGGLLALITVYNQPSSRFYSGLCFILGFMLVGGSLLFLNKLSVFPGINALWPCFGAALLIFAGSNRHPHPLSRILTSHPMVFIGLISYSLYLWHWPIIAYLNYLNIAINPLVGIFVTFLSIMLAWLSWKFVEIPLRRTGSTLFFPQVFFWRFALPVMALLLIGVTTFYMKGFPERFDPRVAKFEKILDAKPDILRSGCHVPTSMYNTPPDAKCRLGMAKQELDGIMIGDSYANHFTGMVDVLSKAAGISIMDYTMDGCPPILMYDTGAAQLTAERCRKRNEAIYTNIAESHFSRVILAGSWPQGAKAGEQLMSSIDIVVKSGAALTIILSNEYIERANSCPIRRIMYHSDEHCEVQQNPPPAYFIKIRTRYPNIHIIDPNQIICRNNTCSPLIGDILLYRDNGHLNDIGSRLIGDSLLKMGVTL
jgi:peptidoglycan/LPS O-acetylase OafA/YrhL